MQIIRNFQNINSKVQNSVLTLGNFDGIHIGHQKILSNAKKIAKEQNLKSALLTFEPHPVKIINPNKAKNIRILSLSQKISFLKKNDLVDLVFIAKFNQKMANLKAEDFVKKILVEQLKVRHLIIGYDFIFGKNRKGDAELLRKLSKIHNFEFSRIEVDRDEDSQIYSSTNIRKFISDGNIKSANSMLGRPYEICGIVVQGKRIARNIGFPTANLLPRSDMILPKFGVYKANVRIKESSYKAIINFGIKPTFNNNSPLFEVHIFDFDTDIYGKKISVELLDFIREERRFESVEMLKTQIVQDCKLAIRG